uniref:lysoplasmalogenase n=1 Tax=Graphocephala atropunctata TaxID=36148 RepID=A0A1B6LWI5_9HEMI
MEQLKSVGPKLVPFLKTVAIYFVLFIPVERPSCFAMIIKCLPILSLIVFVLLHGMSLADEYAFSRRILFGLVFSCFGDALLVWDDYFLHGMFAFGIAQTIYTSAFGFKPLNPALGSFLYSLCGISLFLLLPGLSGVLAVGVPLYSFLLVTTVWRAIARVQFFEELWTWTKLCSCAGGIMWAVSDALIGFHHFHHPIPYSQALIMVTYYAAQLGISLSVVDSRANYHARLEAESRANSCRSSHPRTGCSSRSQLELSSGTN